MQRPVSGDTGSVSVIVTTLSNGNDRRPRQINCRTGPNHFNGYVTTANGGGTDRILKVTPN
jgi:hypothetical protein